ncbi:unnamed protein product [Urochloa decumbens]|uniref:DUF1618 domain-containing protein n=1 Tax=Urochloa decumbens TaxID=240449 RepID=A0ABC9CE22_9POAL
MGDKQSTDHPSLHPSRHGYNYRDDASASSPEDTSWVLLDLKAYIADRENSTTACAAMTSNGETIRVTFCVAPTPLVSYICVWYRRSIGSIEVSHTYLIRVRHFGEVSVQHIGQLEQGQLLRLQGQRRPSLRPIQIPERCLDLPYSIALLGHRDLRLPSHGEDDADAGDGDYYLAGLTFDSCSSSDSTTHYSFWLFDSKAGEWSTAQVSLHGDVPLHITTAIVLRQDGLVGFVDLLRGIVICDVLWHDKPHYLPLPEEAIRRKVSPDWEEDDWRTGYRIQSGDIEVDEGSENVASLLPKLEDGEGNQMPTLERLYTACPVLSLSDRHVVYVMGKVGRREDKALVLSIDMMRRRLQGVAVFDAERMVGITFSYTCTQSRIPDYLNPEPR